MTHNDKRIHLIEKADMFERLSDGSYESGYWALFPATAQALVGGDIYFHETRAKPSFFGGTIIGFRAQPLGEYKGRIIFHLKPDKGHKGIMAGAGGFQSEKKVARSKGPASIRD